MPLEKYKIFDEMIEGIQIVDYQWRYVYVNDTVAIHGKYSKKELLGFTMMEKFPGIEATEMFAHIKECMAHRTPHQMVNEFDFPDGSKGYFELRIQAVEEGVLVLSFDVTKEKLAEQFLQNTNAMLDEKVKQRTTELLLKNKELEQFAYIASHDLQEPLRTLSNYIEVLEEDYYDQLDDTALVYLASMSRATKRMRLLAKSLLDYSRLGLFKQLSKVDCTRLLHEVISDLKNSIEKTGAIVQIGQMPELHAFEVELRQLFQNLITNAIKFSKKDKKPEIRIQSKSFGDKWEFSVSDNGIGIEPVHHERIFQIFQRLHLPEEYEGSGIGLANCKKIVELHGGDIHVSSIVGEGSVFTFTVSNLLQNNG